MNRMMFWKMSLTLSALICIVMPATAETNLYELLYQVREATWYEDVPRSVNCIYIEGSGTSSGLGSGFDFHFFTDGQFRMAVNSRMGTQRGFDGVRGWQVDYTGMSYPLEYWELEVTKMIAWLLGGYWLDPDCPLAASPASVDDDASSTAISMRIAGGVIEFTIHISRQDHLPEKLTWRIYSGENFVELSEYKITEIGYLPSHIVISEEGDITEINVKSIIGSEAAHSLARRPESIRDTEFLVNASPLVEAQLGPHGLLVRATVDKTCDAWFILDCGASCNVIDRALARTLGLEKFGQSKAIGAGGVVDVNHVQARWLKAGPLVIANPTFVALDFGFDADSLNDRIGGILGFDLLSRCLVEIDIPTFAVSIFDSKDYDNSNIRWCEMIFCEDLPAVVCSLSPGHKGVFMLDTGFSGSLLLNTAFVQQNSLLEGKELDEVQLEGVGGEFTGYQGYLDWLEIGGYRIQNPKVVFADSQEGSSSDVITAGTIGSELLLRFDMVVFDYPQKRIGLSY